MTVLFLQCLAKLSRASAIADPHQIKELVVLCAARLVAASVIRRDERNVSTEFLTLRQLGRETLSALNPSVQRAG